MTKAEKIAAAAAKAEKIAAAAAAAKAPFVPEQFEHKTTQYGKPKKAELTRVAETWNTVIDSVESGECKTAAAVVKRFSRIEKTAIARIGRMVNIGYWSVAGCVGNVDHADNREKNRELGEKIVAEFAAIKIKIVKPFPRRSVKR